MYIFETTDVFGNRVSLDTNTWNKHIIVPTGHPEVKDNLTAIKKSIEEPEAVYKDATYPEQRKKFFSRRPESTYPALYTVVVVNYSQDSGNVITSYFSKNFGKVDGSGLLYANRRS
ncbi:MAG: hypothetical protein AB1796_06915 [Bacillota bacterium]